LLLSRNCKEQHRSDTVPEDSSTAIPAID